MSDDDKLSAQVATAQRIEAIAAESGKYEDWIKAAKAWIILKRYDKYVECLLKAHECKE